QPVAQVLHQHVDQRQRQLEGHEQRGHVLAQLQRLLVLGAVLGIDLLELGVHRRQLGEAALDLDRVGAGGAGIGLGGVVVVLVLGVLVLVGILVVGRGLFLAGGRGGDLGLFLEMV